MEARTSPSLDFLLLPPPTSSQSQSISSSEFRSQFSHLNTILLSSNPIPKSTHHNNKTRKNASTFLSTSISIETQSNPPGTKFDTWLKPAAKNNSKTLALMKTQTVFERAVIGAGAGGVAGAFTYFCLHPLDTIKTKLQTRGASEMYTGALDAVAKTFQSKGIWGFYSGISAVIVGSTFSFVVYFGTCEFGKSILSRIKNYPRVLIPPTVGAMGNIVSSAIMIPKELITQRMQAGAKGRSWEVLIKILEKDGAI